MVTARKLPKAVLEPSFDLMEGKADKLEIQQIERSLTRLQRLAKLMDDQFELPIVRYRIGLDPIIGLIPAGGDWVTWAVSVYIVWEALRLGVPIKVLAQMGAQLSVDLIAGYVPGVGDIADVFIKANKRNVQLLFDHFDAEIPSATHPERIEVPQTALTKPQSHPIPRYLFGLALILFLFALATVPIVVLWWLFQGNG